MKCPLLSRCIRVVKWLGPRLDLEVRKKTEKGQKSLLSIHKTLSFVPILGQSHLYSCCISVLLSLTAGIQSNLPPALGYISPPKSSKKSFRSCSTAGWLQWILVSCFLSYRAHTRELQKRTAPPLQWSLVALHLSSRDDRKQVGKPHSVCDGKCSELRRYVVMPLLAYLARLVEAAMPVICTAATLLSFGCICISMRSMWN